MTVLLFAVVFFMGLRAFAAVLVTTLEEVAADYCTDELCLTWWPDLTLLLMRMED